MAKYLLIRKPVGNSGKQLLAEVEAGSAPQAAVKIGWDLREVRFKVLVNGRYVDPRIDSWLPEMGPAILEELREGNEKKD